MRSFLLIVAVFVGLSISAQTPEIIKLADLQRIMSSPGDTTYVINFWATWCVPCVQEFPAFVALAAGHKNEKVRVIMVSLDFKKSMQQSIIPFMAKHPIDGTVLLLDEPDYNSWIDKVNKDWQGEIPVTMIINNARKIKQFFNHDFTKESLSESFNKTIKQ